MKLITTEDQAYVRLARSGDPSAFYALFYGQIRGLYVLHRSRGSDHAAACVAAAEAAARAYRKFIGRGAGGNPRKWFASASGLGKFDAASANASVTGAEEAECVRQVNAALNRAYSDRLDSGSDGKGNFTRERSRFPYAACLIAAALCVAAFLFFAGSVISVSFGRFGAEFKLSFPKIAESLWDMSGLVRADNAAEPENRRGEAALTLPAAVTEEGGSASDDE